MNQRTYNSYVICQQDVSATKLGSHAIESAIKKAGLQKEIVEEVGMIIFNLKIFESCEK